MRVCCNRLLDYSVKSIRHRDSPTGQSWFAHVHITNCYRGSRLFLGQFWPSYVGHVRLENYQSCSGTWTLLRTFYARFQTRLAEPNVQLGYDMAEAVKTSR